MADAAEAHSDCHKCAFSFTHTNPILAQFAVTDALLTEYNFTTNSSSNLQYNLDLNVTVRNSNKEYGICLRLSSSHGLLPEEPPSAWHSEFDLLLPRQKEYNPSDTDLKLGQLWLDHVLCNDDGAISYQDIDVELHVRNRYKAKYTWMGNSYITCPLEVPLISYNRSQAANTNTITSNTWCYYSDGLNFSGFPMEEILIGIFCVLMILSFFLFFGQE
ncbi:hypothetical protein M0R45_011594 [Rubus argutus]|uniref:Uncharacterized protein n=1 Tax=Rubus argutus TaxID=59490 RepID=A0AAW1YBL8_RUBAR